MGKAITDTDPELFKYLLDNSLRDTDLKKRLREETANMPEGGMQITPEQGQLMALLVRLIGARKTLEVGTFTGYSALCVAEALPEDGKLVACDISDAWTRIGQSYWKEAGVEGKIDLRIGPAIETLDTLLEQGEAGAFDFAFLDADKTGYDAYYERALQLLRTGGLVAVDNVLWGGRVTDPNSDDEDTLAIRALNEKIRDDQRVDASMLMVGDGLYLARKR